MRQLIQLVLMVLALPCLSQNYHDVPYSGTAKDAAYVLGNLDFTATNTGYLLDKSLQFAPMNVHDGSDYTEDNILDINVFGKLYATMSNAVVLSKALLPSPDSSYMGALQNWTEKDAIPIAVLDLTYEQFKEDALSNNLISESNGQFFDVANRPSSPYLEKQLFAASALMNTISGLSQEFVVSSDLFISNTEAAITEIRIDFDDGQGEQAVALNTAVLIDYAETGAKDVKVRVTFANGDRKKSHFRLDLKENSIRGGSRYGDVPDWNQTLFGEQIDANGDGILEPFPEVRITAFTHCQDGLIRKPLIYIEGFDPMIGGNQTFEEIFTRLREFEATVGELSLLDHLDNAEYDLIFVDFGDGADYIQSNAMAVKEVIRFVNNEKGNNGSTARNVVIGNSMGGLVGKYALLDFEEDGEDHETRRLLTHDTPFIGANILLSGQFMADQVLNLEVVSGVDVDFDWTWPPLSAELETSPLKDFVPILQDADRALKSPAAQQMLIAYVYDEGGNVHDDFYAELNAKGEGELFDHVAIVNGAITDDGSTMPDERQQLFNPGDLLIDLEGNLSELFTPVVTAASTANPNQEFIIDPLGLITILNIQAFVNFKLFALPNNSLTPTDLYIGEIEASILDTDVAFSHVHKQVSNIIPYDSAPGGMLGAASPPQVATLIAAGFPLTVNATSFCHSGTIYK